MLKKTKKGWTILCQWKDGSTDWVDSRYVKDSNPIELAKYVVANCIQEEPSFKWWVLETLRMRIRIIGKVKSMLDIGRRAISMESGDHIRFRKLSKLTKKAEPTFGGMPFKGAKESNGGIRVRQEPDPGTNL